MEELIFLRLYFAFTIGVFLGRLFYIFLFKGKPTKYYLITYSYQDDSGDIHSCWETIEDDGKYTSFLIFFKLKTDKIEDKVKHPIMINSFVKIN